MNTASSRLEVSLTDHLSAVHHRATGVGDHRVPPGPLIDRILDQAHAVETDRAPRAPSLWGAHPVSGSVDTPAAVTVGNALLVGGVGEDRVGGGRGGMHIENNAEANQRAQHDHRGEHSFHRDSVGQLCERMEPLQRMDQAGESPAHRTRVRCWIPGEPLAAPHTRD